MEVVPAEQNIGLGAEIPREQLGQRDRQAACRTYRVVLQAGQGPAKCVGNGPRRLRNLSDGAEIRARAGDHRGTRGS